MALKKILSFMLIVVALASCWSTRSFVRRNSDIRFGDLDTALARKKIHLNGVYIEDTVAHRTAMTFFDDGLAVPARYPYTGTVFTDFANLGVYDIKGDTIFANCYFVRTALIPIWECVESIVKRKYKIINEDSLLLVSETYYDGNWQRLQYIFPNKLYLREQRDSVTAWKFYWLDRRSYNHLKKKRYLRPRNRKSPFKIKKIHYVE